ncbi:MAG: PqqD family protein [Deltaproteobacteria bacterium]|nr:PqqD family protein [Deltaproteobacteria bacterium]
MLCSQQKATITNKQNSSYVRNPKIAERSIDDTVFLINPENDIVFYLNPLGTGIWQLLREPISVFDARIIVQQAFPDLPPNQIARDISKLFNDMIKRNLVLNDE